MSQVSNLVQSAEQVCLHEAARAGMQRLPAGICPQPAPHPAGFCHVCFTEEYTDDNLLLEVSASCSGFCCDSS